MFPDQIFEAEAISVSSGVSDQPMSSQETLLGAQNRAKNAREALTDADYWVGIEGGLEEQDNELVSFSWIVILSGEKQGRAKTASYSMPTPLTKLVKAGKELGEAVDTVFGESNSKQKNGAVGLLTGNVVDRTSLYEQAVILALLPFLKPSYTTTRTKTNNIL